MTVDNVSMRDDVDGARLCNTCGVWKLVEFFRKKKSQCAVCHLAYCKRYRENGRKPLYGVIKRQSQINPDGTKTCVDCSVAIAQDLLASNGYQCKKCYNAHMRDFSMTPGQKEKRMARYAKNQKHILEQKKEYREAPENKVKLRELNKKWMQRKTETDPSFRLRRNVSSNIRIMLIKNGGSKLGASCLKHLPYSLTELKTYIESIFEPWMTWNNLGVYSVKTWDDNDMATWTWQLDHVVPHSKFKYTTMDCEEFRACWALSNLRPYSAKQNILDGNRR